MIPYGLSKPDFENFIFPEFFGNLCREFFAKFQKKRPNLSEKWSNFFGKMKISKSGLERL